MFVCVSVSPSGHLVPGTNSEIERLTLEQLFLYVGLTIALLIGKSETNNRKGWD